jgi:signal transduction histidine kinase
MRKQALAREVERARALYRLSQMVTASLDLDTTLDAIAGAIHQLTASSLTAILLFDESGDSLQVRVARGEVGATVGQRISIDDGLIGRAVRERCVVLDPDLGDARLGARALVAAPLIWGGKPLGVVILGSTDSHGLSDEDVDLVTTVADQAAAAVAHAHAFAEEQQRRADSEALARQLTQQAEQLARMQQQLVQAEKMTAIGQLVDGIAHEMNTPLGVLISNLSVLDEYTNSLAAAARTAQTAPAGPDGELDYILTDLPQLIAESTGAASKVADIVRSMAVFARGEAQRPVAVNVEEAVESALTLACNTLKHRGQVVRDFASQLPPVLGQSSELTQVFLHLLLNAADALEQGQGVVTVRTRHAEGMVEVSIHDTGRGIPPSLLPRLFDPFFSTRPPGKGTGMGLTVCHGIVTRHRGTIELRNAPAGGAIASVRLPSI